MLQIQEVVNQLDDKVFKEFSKDLETSKAKKFHSLLNHIRANKLSDKEIMKAMRLNQNAYYTLKSRLFEKTQDYLLTVFDGDKSKLIRKVANLPELLFNTPRETSISILKKLERTLQANDMNHELSLVYLALKKFHQYDPEKHYKYSKLYNTYIAYSQAVVKVEDLLCDFTSWLVTYNQSKEKEHLQLVVTAMDEIKKQCKLYDSHHMNIYRCIAEISVALFLPLEMKEEEESIEEMLDQFKTTLEKFPGDTTYRNLWHVYNYLSFEYYHQLKQYRKELIHYNEVNPHVINLLQSGFFTSTSQFLTSKLVRAVRKGTQKELWAENAHLIKNYSPNKQDWANYINYIKYLSVSAFYSGKTKHAIQLLETLFEEGQLRKFPHAEIELKLFLSALHTITNDDNAAWSVLTSVTRKIRLRRAAMGYENASLFVKILKVPMNPDTGNSKEKALRYRDRFAMANHGEQKMLEFLKLDDDFVMKLVTTL